MAFQFWARRACGGAPPTWPSAAPTTATPSAPCRSAPTTGFGAAPVRPAALPGPAGARLRRRPSCFDVACRHGRRARRPAGRGGRRAARPGGGGHAHGAAPEAFAGPGRRLPGGRRAADPRRGGHRVRPHRHPVRHRAVRAGVRPDLLCLGKGITGGYLPLSVTVASGRVFDAFAGDAVSPTGTPTAATPWPRRWPCATCACSASATCWPTWPPARPSCRRLLAARVRPLRRRRRRPGEGPAGRGRRGRRRRPGAAVCDAAVAAGVLLRPHRRHGDHRARRSPSPPARSSASSTCWPGRSVPGMSAGRGSTASAEPSRRPGGGGGSPTSTTAWSSFASNDYLGLSRHPAVVAAAHDALDRWGAGAGVGPAGGRLPPGPRRAGGGAGRLEGRAGRPAVPDRLRRQPRRAGHLRPAPACGCCPTSATTRRSSTAAGCPGPRWRLPPRRPRPRRADLLRPARRPADGRRHRHRLLHGRRRGAGRRAGRAVRRPRRPARARRGPRRPRAPTPTSTASTTCGWAPCRSTSARWAASWPAPGRFVDLLVNRARPFIFTTASSPRPTPPPPWPPCGCCGRPRATGWSPACAATSTSPARPPLPYRADRDRRRGGRPGRLAPPCRTGLLVPAIRPPTVAPGNVPPAGLPVGHPHRRADRPPDRGPACPARPERLVVVLGTEHRRGQDVGGGRGAAPARRRRGPGGGPQAGAVLRPADPDAPTPTCWPAPPARRRRTSAPGTAGTRHPGPADRRRLPRPARRRVDDLVAELAWPADTVDRDGGDRRRPPVADRRRRRQRRPGRAWPPTWPCSSPTPAWAPSTPCGCRSTCCSRLAGRRLPQPLRRQRRPRPQPRLAAGRRLRRDDVGGRRRRPRHAPPGVATRARTRLMPEP